MASEALRAHGIEFGRLREETARQMAAEGVPTTHGQAAKDALSTLGIDVAEIRRRADETFGPNAFKYPRAAFSLPAKKAVQASLQEARELGHERIDTEHLLLAVLTRDDGAVRVLGTLGVGNGGAAQVRTRPHGLRVAELVREQCRSLSVGQCTLNDMRWVVHADEDGGGLLAPLADEASAAPAPARSAAEPCEVRRVEALAEAIRDLETESRPRWIWADTTRVYPDLLRAGVRVARCHDVVLVDEILAARAGLFGAPRTLGAAYARLHDLPVPDVGRMTAATEAVGGGGPQQQALFSPDETGLPAEVEPLSALIEVYQAQLAQLEQGGPGLRLLAAAESAGALAAAEMTHAGLPLDPELHSAQLTEALGPMPAFGGPGARPAKLQELAERVAEAFNTPALNPDSPAQLLKALSANGLPVHTTRAWELREFDHPGVPLLLEYKELARLYSANGWTRLRAWVREGRFRPEYVVGGVVTGRWASRGGGALQLPTAVRRAVVADPGRRFVVADAGQLEPRVLAAISADRGLAEAARAEDLYTELGDVFGGHRAKAKLGLLGAMYGQTSGEVGPLLVTLRRRFPRAIALVDEAAKAGIEGRVVSNT